MDFKSIYIFCFAFCFSFNLNEALRCYWCSGSSTSDCAKGKTSSMGMLDCKVPGESVTQEYYPHFNVPILEQSSPVNGSQLEGVCLRFYDSRFKQKFVVRACTVVQMKFDICKYLQEKKLVSNCKACRTERCNRGGDFQLDDDFYNEISD